MYNCPAQGDCTYTCGNGILEANEVCDDGNLVNGDGCTYLCQFEPGWTCRTSPNPTICMLCGNGLIGTHEQCDDINTSSGDGCDNFCQVEAGWVCDFKFPNDTHSTCARCGDG